MTALLAISKSWMGHAASAGIVCTSPCPTASPAADDTFLVVASDGLFAEELRGGGGGLDNATLCELLQVGLRFWPLFWAWFGIMNNATLRGAITHRKLLSWLGGGL